MAGKEKSKIEIAHGLMREQLDKHGHVDRQPIMDEMKIDAPTFASYLQRMMQYKPDPLVLTSDPTQPGRYVNNAEAASLFKEAYAKTDAVRGTQSTLSEEEKKLQKARKEVQDGVRRLRVSVANLKFIDAENTDDWLNHYIVKDLDLSTITPQRKPLTAAEKKKKADAEAAAAGEQNHGEGTDNKPQGEGTTEKLPAAQMQANASGDKPKPSRTRVPRK